MEDKYHYSILGLKMNATQSEISKAWKNLALVYHPDKTKLDKTQASEKFIQLEKSYQYLKSKNELSSQFAQKIDKIIDSREFDKQFESNLVQGYKKVTQQREQHQSVLNLLSSLNANLNRFEKQKQSKQSPPIQKKKKQQTKLKETVKKNTEPEQQLSPDDNNEQNKNDIFQEKGENFINEENQYQENIMGLS